MIFEAFQELGARFLRPRHVLDAVCALSARLGEVQREHQRLGLFDYLMLSVILHAIYVHEICIYR